MKVEINWQVILLALIAATPPTIIAWHTGQRVDGRMDELLTLTREKATAQATVTEKNAESQRQIDAKKAAKALPK